MARVSVERQWSLAVTGDDRVLLAANKVALEYGLQADPDGTGLKLRCGSQFRTRLLGGWFVKPDVLPTAGSVQRYLSGERELVTLRLEDRIGPGFMDPKLRRKYEQRLDEIAVAFDVELNQLTT